MPRKSITDMIPEMEAPPAQSPAAAVTAPPPPPAAKGSATSATTAPERTGDGASDLPPRRSEKRAAAGTGRPRPSARDLAVPARQSVLREALKADVPAQLGLLTRLRRYRLDKGMDIRDQVAIAVDEWLAREGY